jgi:hypothetical protein
VTFRPVELQPLHLKLREELAAELRLAVEEAEPRRNAATESA